MCAYFQTRRKRNEFNTTDIELNAIAPPAKIGFNNNPNAGHKTPAATGINTML